MRGHTRKDQNCEDGVTVPSEKHGGGCRYKGKVVVVLGEGEWMEKSYAQRHSGYSDCWFVNEQKLRRQGRVEAQRWKKPQKARPSSVFHASSWCSTLPRPRCHRLLHRSLVLPWAGGPAFVWPGAHHRSSPLASVRVKGRSSGNR